jgi:hypothetical protein
MHVWAVSHYDYYQVMFGTELDEVNNAGRALAGDRAFGDLLDVIVRCQQDNLQGLLFGGR